MFVEKVNLKQGLDFTIDLPYRGWKAEFEYARNKTEIADNTTVKIEFWR